MSSKVPISNLAIAALGHKAFIQSMTENSVEARYANLFYDQSRKSTLRAHPWNFATGRKQLAILSTTPVGPWTYTYALPTGCMKARYIGETYLGRANPFEVALNSAGDTRVLYTNAPDAVLVYTHNVENADLFDPLFTDAFSLNLAFRLAPTIAPSKAQEIANKYLAAMRAAQAADAGEGQAEPSQAPDWLDNRVTGSGDDLYQWRRSLNT